MHLSTDNPETRTGAARAQRRVIDLRQRVRSPIPFGADTLLGASRALARAIGGNALDIARALAEGELADAADEAGTVRRERPTSPTVRPARDGDEEARGEAMAGAMAKGIDENDSNGNG